MPPKTLYPTPALRFHNSAWKIVWSHNGKQYSVSTGLPKEDKLFAEKWRIDFAIALKNDIPSFPDKFKSTKSVVKYVRTRYGVSDKIPPGNDPGQWISDYGTEIRGKNTANWIRDSLAMLNKLGKASGGIKAVNEKMASSYMADIAATRSAGTHNRTLTVFKKFYEWLVDTKRHTVNPFKKIKRMIEREDTPIIYCTPSERDEIIALSKASGRPEWLAVPIAFYSGLRREEVSRLAWGDIRAGEGLVVVRKSKTGKSRVLPLASALEKILSEIPDAKRRGPVVVTPEGIDRLFRLDNLVRHIRRVKRERMLAGWNLPRPAPSKSKEYREKAKAWKKAKAVKDAEIAVALERIGWNPFRHTFGSLLAQAGVSIDKISAWMGNTPEVCRRHYAQFVPRDRRDSEIDKL